MAKPEIIQKSIQELLAYQNNNKKHPPEQIKAFRIMDNKSAESEFDFDALATEFQSLLQEDA